MTTLCIALNETRGADVTFPSLNRRLLAPFGASLAYSGGLHEGATNPYSNYLDFDWSIPEPEDWHGFRGDRFGDGLGPL